MLSNLFELTGIHARQWIAPAVASYFIQQLIEVPANAKLLQSVDWYIMPVMNPDGSHPFLHFSATMRFMPFGKIFLF